MNTVKIGIINRTINMLDFLLGDQIKIYESHGIKAEFDLVAGNESIELLLDEKLDFVVSIGAATRAIMTKNSPVRVALLVHQNAPHWFMARSDIKSVKNLRGKKIQAAQPGSEPDVMVRKYISENGLNPEVDVELVYERAHQGWKKNGPAPVEDAVIARTLEQEVLEEMGYHTLVELCEQYPNTLIHGLVTTEKILKEKFSTVEAMIASHKMISEWIDEGREEVLEFVESTFNVSEERARRALSSMKGKFVARMEPSDFGSVIESSAKALGSVPIPVNRLIAQI